MKKVLRLTLLLILLVICSHAQRVAIDSMLNQLKQPLENGARATTMLRLSFQIAEINPDSGVLLGKQALELSTKLKIDSSCEASYNSLGWSYYRSEKYDSAESCFLNALALCQKLHIKIKEARVRSNLVTVFETTKNFQKALAYALPITGLLEGEKDEMVKAFSQKQIGIIYRDMGQFERAKTYIRSAMADFLKISDTGRYMSTIPSLGGLFVMQKKFDSALVYYRIALAYKERNVDINTAFAYENMGDAFINMADSLKTSNSTDSAFYYYLKAKSVFEKFGGRSDVAYEEKNIGKCLIYLKRYPEAIQYLTRALNVLRKNGDLDYQSEVIKSLAEAYSASGNFKLAYAYVREYITVKDSVDANNNNEKIASMFAQYETDKKDRAIVLLNTQEKLDQQQIGRQRILAVFFVSLALLGVFIGLILWNRKGIKQKLKEVEMRNQLSSDLHDDIGSSLSSILLLSTMATQNKNNEQIHDKLLEKINNNAKEVIERMSDIVWTMNPKYDEGESLLERLENYIARLKEVTNITINSNIDKKIEQYHFSMELRKNIFLIIKEAMNNALKYADASLLQLEVVASENYFEVLVKDDGVGFDKAETLNGNGFETMINRARASKGDCKITSACGKGTEVKAVIPIPHIR